MPLTFDCSICNDTCRWSQESDLPEVCKGCSDRGEELLGAHVLSGFSAYEIARLEIAISNWELHRPRWCADCYRTKQDCCVKCLDRAVLKIWLRDLAEARGKSAA